jgi:enamine deaminase RidA (YjgF/YER057c/UK114 family)
MAVNIDVRSIQSPQAVEFYISASPAQKAPPDVQWRQIFTAIRDALLAKKGYILQERVFGTAESLKIAPKIRSEIYGSIDDGIHPVLLVCKESLLGPVAGVQIHACAADIKPQKIITQGIPRGRIIKLPGKTFLTLSGISGPTSLNPQLQAKKMMETAEAILKKYDVDFFSVPRTWMWLSDILSWYGDFNIARNQFFTQRGLITQDNRLSLPASTGIGLAPADGSSCAMDLIAVLEPSGSIEYLPAAGRQHCPFKYGSAFSRAAVSLTPAAKSVFISGTACIDAEGKTAHIDDPAGQINETIQNVRSVLNDVHCKDSDVLSVIAYCKNTEVQRIFNDIKRSLSWPVVTAICDICRRDLLFELEATAVLP